MLPTSHQHQYQLLCLKEFQHKLLVRSCIYKHYSKDLSSFHSFLTVFGGKEGRGGGGEERPLEQGCLKLTTKIKWKWRWQKEACVRGLRICNVISNELFKSSFGHLFGNCYVFPVCILMNLSFFDFFIKISSERTIGPCFLCKMITRVFDNFVALSWYMRYDWSI